MMKIEGYLPLYSIHAACGYFENSEQPDVEGWIDASGYGFTPDKERQFVVRAKGNSMQPLIHDGDFCVFEWYRGRGVRDGEVVLTQSSEYDKEYGGKYTIKKFHSETIVSENVQYNSVELIPLNKDYDVIRLDSDKNYNTIGIFKCILSDRKPSKRNKYQDIVNLEEKVYHLGCNINDIITLSEDYLMAAEPFFEEKEDLCCQTFIPRVNHSEEPLESQVTQNIDDNGYCNVYSSVFSPAEVKRKTNMLVQVYLHLQEETEKVITLAQEAQKNAERRDYIPLQCRLKRGDKVDISLNIYGETLLQSEKKSVIWFGSFTKCSFSYFIPKDIEIDELRCVAILSVNGAQIGEMCFVTEIVETPRSLHPEVFTRKYKKIFISYAHQDESKVKFIAQAYKAQGVDYFFDRDYLKAGDIFPQKIEDYINSADLFILCWSKNAAQSDYVKKERNQALDRAYPKVKPIEKAPLSIYPLSIDPREELPEDMRDTYNFEIV